LRVSRRRARASLPTAVARASVKTRAVGKPL
jgi:hypothetical protein